MLAVALCTDADADDDTHTVDRLVAAYYPPLMIAADVEAPGISIEIAQEAARRAGRTVTVEFMPFQRALYTVQNDPNALVPALFRNRQRENSFAWVAYTHASELRFMSTDMPVDTLAQAAALDAIGVEGGASTEMFLTEQGFTNLVSVADPDSSARMLHAGRIQAWFLTEPLARRIWRNIGFDQPVVAGDVIHEFPIYIAANRDIAPEAATAYAAAIDGMREDGTIDRILAKYQ